MPSVYKMLESDPMRFIAATIFLAVYSVLEHYQLGVVSSILLSLLLIWRRRTSISQSLLQDKNTAKNWTFTALLKIDLTAALSVCILIADICLFLWSVRVYSYIPFLISETILLIDRAQKVRDDKHIIYGISMNGMRMVSVLAVVRVSILYGVSVFSFILLFYFCFSAFLLFCFSAILLVFIGDMAVGH